MHLHLSLTDIQRLFLFEDPFFLDEIADDKEHGVHCDFYEGGEDGG